MPKPTSKGKGKGKNEDLAHLQELYVEPPLLYRLFPTLLKSKEPSAKALAKQAAKATKPAFVKPKLPIADLLPNWLVDDVKRRAIGRQFILVYVLVLLAFGALLVNIWRDTQFQQTQLDAAAEEVANAQSGFGTLTPLVDYSVTVRDAAEYGNAQALSQLNNASIINAILSNAPGNVTLSNVIISFGATESASCAPSGGGSNPFDDGSGTQIGIGCVAFEGTAGNPESLGTMESSLAQTAGFIAVTITPGQVDERDRYLFTGSATIGEELRINSSPALILNVSDLPQESPTTVPTSSSNADTAAEGGESQ